MPGSVAEPGDDVLEDLLASAAEHEARDSWSMALADYRAALERDPESAKARAGRARAETALAQHQFQAAMSRGFAALERGDHGRAVEAFREAQAADPKNPAVRDAMAQAREAVRLARIASLRLEAEAMADQEQWAAAAGVYDRILGIDGNLAFAKAGRARNELLGRTAAQLDYYLDEPELLYSNKARASARLFEKGLAELDTTGAPGLQQRIARFREQLELASEPLPLQIRSDNQTEIIVYHMGRLGRFESKFIELLPGQWTLVGSRPGYRDVRLELNIRPGVTPTPVYIACEEAI
jgi:tetratricopeptide (TPR) repeat protein